MDFLNKLLAGFISNFKTKNPKVFGLIITVLIVAYVGIETAIVKGALMPNSLTTDLLKYVDLVMLAIVGSKTTPYLKEYLGSVGAQSNVDGIMTFLANLIDGFKVRSPWVFAIMSLSLIVSFVGIEYAVQLELLQEKTWVLETLKYIDLVAIVLLGSRTGKYLMEHPPRTEIGAQSVDVLYYD